MSKLFYFNIFCEKRQIILTFINNTLAQMRYFETMEASNQENGKWYFFLYINKTKAFGVLLQG